METFLLLATGASSEAAESGGFGLNLNLLETNLINLAILIGVLFYLGRNIVTNILTERKKGILETIAEAETRQRQAAEALADQQQKLAQAQAEAERIRKEAEATAQAAKESILAQAAKEEENLRKKANEDLNTETERVLAELRQRVSALAIQRVESQLNSVLDESAQQQLVNNSIALLGGNQ
ncbi:F0F1 ATP synthase subunit B [Floridanema evergladense]|uniref:ATP synthase subunit b n=1 Tax=Floridaenema evergladense BLCC-F167 TaxID=3153639 RepID=A0ABV4WVM4_9CYAN